MEPFRFMKSFHIVEGSGLRMFFQGRDSRLRLFSQGRDPGLRIFDSYGAIRFYESFSQSRGLWEKDI